MTDFVNIPQVWLDKGKAQENEEEKGKAEGYKLWLASDPKCNDTDWVAKCAPTKWKIMAGEKNISFFNKIPNAKILEYFRG